MAALESEDPRSIGDYQVVERLGAGGMGRVYLGRSPGGRRVAVKVVHSELVRQPEFRTRFRREVAAARAVSGAFTAPVIDADPDAPQPWLVTSFIAGPSLADAVTQQGAMSVSAVFSLAAGLAEALVSIHGAGLVHRDLKPSNVLLSEDGPRVIDFGIARVMESSSSTMTGLVVGSPGFMSPEQVNASDITPASDIFSLGAVLAFAATGANPFGNGPTPSLLYRVVHSTPELESIPDPALRALISDCLAKEPEQRPGPREILDRTRGSAGAAMPQTRVHAEPGEGPAAWGGHPSFPAQAQAPASSGTESWPLAPPMAAAPAASGPAATGPAAPTGFGPAAPYPPAAYGAPNPAPTPAGGFGADVPSTPGRRKSARRTVLISGVAAVVVLAVAAVVGFRFLRSAGEGVTPVAYWSLTRHTGDRVADTAGGHTATAVDVRWPVIRSRGALFNGRSSRITTSGPVLNTGPGKSFTVSAWVRIDSAGDSFRTAVSQDSSVSSGFYLQYSGQDHRWAFSRPGVRALSATRPAVGVWTHLVGVNDAAQHQLRLYVNGRAQGTARLTTTEENPAHGVFAIGRATGARGRTDYFPGGIKDVKAFDKALTAKQVETVS